MMSEFSEQLIFLIRNGENARAKSIIECTHLHNSVDTTGATLLHYAAKSGNVNITKYLLDKGSYVDSQDIAGKTSLIMAMRRNHVEIIKILLDAGADVTALNKKNENALHYFARQHNLSITVSQLILEELQKMCSTSSELAKKIIDAGCQLYQAVCLCNITVIKYMLRQGFSSNSVHPTTKQTALHIAVSLNQVEIVKVLLQYDADVNAIDINGANPLFYMYQNSKQTCEKKKILEMLLNSGISSTLSTIAGLFQITHVLSRGSREIISMVLQSNIDFKSKDNIGGRNILHSLAINCNPGVVEELNCHIAKFDVNVVDNNKISPLFFAVVSGNVKMVEFLLEHGSDPNCIQLTRGFTPLYYALTKSKLGFESQNTFLYRSDQCIELLLEYGADPQILVTKPSGEIATVFDTASESNYLYRVKPVIAHLAMLEALGKPIAKIICVKIDSHQNLKEYFNKCKQILERKVIGSTTVIKLLDADNKKLLSYFRSKKSLFTLERLLYKPRAMTCHFHYYETLRKRLSRGIYQKRFRRKASEVVCKILQSTVDNKKHVVNKDHVVIDKIVDYLNNKDLCKLYEF